MDGLATAFSNAADYRALHLDSRGGNQQPTGSLRIVEKRLNFGGSSRFVNTQSDTKSRLFLTRRGLRLCARSRGRPAGRDEVHVELQRYAAGHRHLPGMARSPKPVISVHPCAKSGALFNRSIDEMDSPRAPRRQTPVSKRSK
jgi:hypothetical protein